MDQKPSYAELEQTLTSLNIEIDRLKSDRMLNSLKFSVNETELAELREAGEKYRELYENLSDWIFTHDLDGNLIENNFHFIKLLGYSEEELKGANVKDLMPERYRPDFDQYLKRITSAGKDSGIMKIMTATGSELTVEYTNILIKNPDGAYHIQGIARDITERINAETALRQSEQKFRSIIENIQEGYFEVDLQGKFTFANKSLCRIIGYTEAELLGMNHTTYMNEHHAGRIQEVYTAIFNSGDPVDGVEFELIRKDRQIRHIVTSVSLIHSPSRKPMGFRGIARDITDKKKLEDDLATLQAKALNAKEVTIMGLAKLSEYRDNDAGTHLERMREFSKYIAQELSSHNKYKGYITEKYINDIYQSAILHDIGKVGIPDAVLLKPGKLSPEEFAIIKEHSRLGGDALSAIEKQIKGESFLTLAKEIAYYHHERWNGKGYPKGLKGDEIPLSARIVALADVYDALTSKRVYKEAFSHEEAVKIIVSERGRQFDPDIVDAFMARNRDFLKLRQDLEAREADELGLKLSIS
jgi:PAS domain S-box-containing protein